MTEENQKRRAYLAEIETIVHETLASQPADDSDCVRCGMALDRGIDRIEAKCYAQAMDRIPTSEDMCQVCHRPLGREQMHVVWFGPPSAKPAHAVLCTGCYDFVFSPLRKVPSWTLSGRHG